MLLEEKRKVLESKAREELLQLGTSSSQPQIQDYGKDARGKLITYDNSFTVSPLVIVSLVLPKT